MLRQCEFSLFVQWFDSEMKMKHVVQRQKRECTNREKKISKRDLSFNTEDACVLTATLWFWTCECLYYVIFILACDLIETLVKNLPQNWSWPWISRSKFFSIVFYSSRSKTFPKNLIVLFFWLFYACVLTATLWFWTRGCTVYVIFVLGFTNIWFIIIVASASYDKTSC